MLNSSDGEVPQGSCIIPLTTEGIPSGMSAEDDPQFSPIIDKFHLT
jgi:hypothetical protein